jgi:hypothetical protein
VKNNYDVITTTDKAKRDDIFRQMRESTDPLERASVKFSGNEPVINDLVDPPVQLYAEVKYSAHVKGGNLQFGKSQQRPIWVSIYSVATPRD